MPTHLERTQQIRHSFTRSPLDDFSYHIFKYKILNNIITKQATHVNFEYSKNTSARFEGIIQYFCFLSLVKKLIVYFLSLCHEIREAHRKWKYRANKRGRFQECHPCPRSIEGSPTPTGQSGKTLVVRSLRCSCLARRWFEQHLGRSFARQWN